ncbi:hypothetical protein I4Z71_004863 [Salmonella enterica subsp. enterica serovar Grumpensis]|nr:hypothetical protein [Salmonella enterica subsp. enterica serovar Grumpensis]
MKKVLSLLVPGCLLWGGSLAVGHAALPPASAPVQNASPQSDKAGDTPHGESTVPALLPPALAGAPTTSAGVSDADKTVQHTQGGGVASAKADTDVSNRQEVEKLLQEQKKLKVTQQQLLAKIDELTKEMYLSNANFGDKNGPGYYYRFTRKPGVRKTASGFYYSISSLIARKTKPRGGGVQAAGIRPNDFVTFSLKESFPDGKVVSETPILTVMNDSKLPDVVRAAFAVGGKDEMVTIVTLGKQIYSDGDKNDYPQGITPETTLIYTFRIVGVQNNDSQEMNVLKPRG